MVIRLKKSFLIGRKAAEVIHAAHAVELARTQALPTEQATKESAVRDEIINNINKLADDRRKERTIRDEVIKKPIGPGSNL